MKASRRKFVTAGLGLAAGVGWEQASQAQNAAPKPAAQTPPAHLELLDFQPRSMLAVPAHPITKAKMPAIDAHTHVSSNLGKPRAAGTSGPIFLEEIVGWMDAMNIQTILNLTGGTGQELKDSIAMLDGKYPGRFLNCVEPAYDKAHEPGYPQWQAEELARAKEAGAVGLKLLKTLGLYLRENGKTGPLVKIDDPRFDPMWDAAGQLGFPVIIHTADPDAFFTPIDRFNERWEELGNHPSWSFYGKDYPTKPELLAARNRVIERHPKTIFVGAHVANHPENLDEVSAWFDKYPNLYCDIAARVGELGRQPRRAARFFHEYQDRILFGTDASPNAPGVPQQDLKPGMYHAYFRFLETLDEYFEYAASPTPPQGRWCISGIELPDSILKKVYHDNAARLLGLKLL